MCFDVSDVSAEVFLKLFGEHFFTFCKQAGYDTMLRTLGGNLLEFIGNLDALHSYLALSYQVWSCVLLLGPEHRGCRGRNGPCSRGARNLLFLHYTSFAFC